MRVSFAIDAPDESIENTMIDHLKQELLKRARDIYDPRKWLTISGWARHEGIDRRTLTGWLKACGITIEDVRVHCSNKSM